MHSSPCSQANHGFRRCGSHLEISHTTNYPAETTIPSSLRLHLGRSTQGIGLGQSRSSKENGKVKGTRHLPMQSKEMISQKVSMKTPRRIRFTFRGMNEKFSGESPILSMGRGIIGQVQPRRGDTYMYK